MSKWTPEPWYAHGAFIVSDQGGTDERVNIYDTDPSNRERIVACIAACKGLHPAAIPALVKAVATYLDADPQVRFAAYQDLMAAFAALTTPDTSDEKGGGQ